MYKLGIVLFGQPRYYTASKLYFDQAFASCEIDYFGHTWNIHSVDDRNQLPDRSIKDVKYDINKLKQELQDVYDTSNIIVSDYDRQCKLIGSRYVHQWRSFEKVSKLLKRSVKKYDLIICSRFDVVFEPKPDLIKRLLDIIEKYKSIDNELLICANADKPSQAQLNNKSEEVSGTFNSMYDLLWFGTKEGVIKFGYNFTRNIKNDPNFLKQGYRKRWADQIRRNKVTHYIIPDRKWRHKWGNITLMKPGCPSLDLKTIRNYGRYYDTIKGGKIKTEDWKEYDPKIKYK